MPQNTEKKAQLCPLRAMEPCNPDCAWRRAEDCAVTLLAMEAFAVTEAYLIVNRLKAVDENKEASTYELDNPPNS